MDYNLKLSWADVNLIWEALGMMPYKQVNALIQDLLRQIKEQEPKIIDKKDIK